MRTTLDLPDDLLRRVKASAALRGTKMKDLIASFIERGLQAPDQPAAVRGHRTPLPEFVPRTAVPIPSLSSSDVEEILLNEELESVGRH